MLERRLGGLPGVERLSTDVVRQQLRVCYDAAVTSASAIAEAVAETGMRAWVDRERDAAPVAVPACAISARCWRSRRLRWLPASRRV